MKKTISLVKLPLDNSSLDSNSWLTPPGWLRVEADGSFFIKVTEGKKKSKIRERSSSRRVTYRFRVEQRQFDRVTNISCYSFMHLIAIFSQSLY